MGENYFLKYFKINKILLHCGGVLPIEGWGFIPNAISIIVPHFCVYFLIIPPLYTFIFRDLDYESAIVIFSKIVEGVNASFKGYYVI